MSENWGPWRCFRDPAFIRFDTIPVCDRRIDRRPQYIGLYHVSIASCRKNVQK